MPTKDDVTSYAEHMRSMDKTQRCPNCGESMDDEERCILRVGEGNTAWDLCSLACSVIFFKKKFPGSVGNRSSIEKIIPSKKRPAFQEIDLEFLFSH